MISPLPSDNHNQTRRIRYPWWVLFLPFLWHCDRQEKQVFPKAPVILITVDTLRSDHLPAYGYTGVKTPHLDQFAADAILYEQAFAHSPITLPSHATMMTGHLPQNHGVRENIGFILEDEAATLAESFKAANYATAGFVSSMVLRPETGISQGFDHFEGPFLNQNQKLVRTFAQQNGEKTLEQASQWLAQHKDDPFFIWVHLYEPHTPYDPPQAFLDQYSKPYDAEIAYTDEILGGFLEQLKTQGLYEKSVVLLASDHGESLGEHGEVEHGLFVYRPAIQIPFMVKLPQQILAGQRLGAPVGLFDVYPTLLGLADLPIQPHDGWELLGSKPPPMDRSIYSEAMTAELNFGWHSHRGIVQEGFHYLQGAQPEVFDLKNDFGEINNLAKQKSFPRNVREALLRSESQRKNQTEISDEEKALLASLGYTGGFNMGGEIRDLSKDKFLDLFYQLDQTLSFLNEKQFVKAEALLVPMLQSYPSVTEARVLLGVSLRQQEKFDQAAHVYMEGLALTPKDITLLKGLALTQMKLGAMDQAKQIALKAADENPREITQDLIPSFFDHQHFDIVTVLVNRVLEVMPNYAFGIFALGRIANAEKRFPEALTHLTKAMEVSQVEEDEDTYQRALFWLGDTYGRQGKYPSAKNLFIQILRNNPDHAGARASLSMVFASTREPRKAIQNLDEWVGQFPTRENFLKAAETMDQIGLKAPADFYRAEAAKLEETHSEATPSNSNN